MDQFRRATIATCALVLSVATVGLLAQRDWGRLPLAVPNWPYRYAVPFYVFPGVQLRPWWSAAALPVVAAAVAGVLALHRSAVGWPVRVAASAALLFVLALATSAMAGGPAAWAAPFQDAGEYPHGVGLVASVPAFLGRFPELVPALPFHARGHPAGAMVLYALLGRLWSGLGGAAVLTVAIGALGAGAVAGLARDELGDDGGRLALALWVLSPVVVLYTATSADAVFALVLASSALAADRGLRRRSVAWTLAGGAGLWASSMLTYAAVLLLAVLLVRAAGHLRQDPGWVARWAALTAAIVLAMTGLLTLATGYDVVAAVRAGHAAYAAAPGSAGRSWLLYLAGDPVAFGAMLGLPLLAALAARTAAVVRERAWTSFDAAALALLVAGSAWGFSKAEVERIFLFMAPLLLVPAARQLLAWRVRLGVVAALLVAQTLLVQAFCFTRW